MVENSLDLKRIQHIRAYYHRQLAGEHDCAALGLAIVVGVLVALAAFAVQVAYISRSSVSLGG